MNTQVFKYESINETDIAIIGFNNQNQFDQELIIPDEILGQRVTTINDGAFENLGYLSAIKFPNTLKRIGDYAFENTYSNQIIIPDTVDYIGKCAFSNGNGCRNVIKEMKLPINLLSKNKTTVSNYHINDLFIVGDTDVIGECHLDNCEIDSLRVPASLTHIDNNILVNVGKLVVPYNNQLETSQANLNVPIQFELV